MVFPSSVSIYHLDPSNWHQNLNPNGIGSSSSNSNGQLPQPPQFNLGGENVIGVAAGSASATTKPNSMSERARVAKIPQPEAALKCPRCESTNTKFCYFNNYNLSQPRHFCKTCRRYWTRGGALRNVPVGGGCRRNKRTKSNIRSKSATTAVNGSGGGGRGTSSSSSPLLFPSSQNLGHNYLVPHHHQHQLPLLPPLNNLGGVEDDVIGLNFSGLNNHHHQHQSRDHQSESWGGGGGGGVGPSSSSGIVEQWRMQQQQVHQFPFFANLEPHQQSSVKMEGNSLLSSRNFLGSFSSSEDQEHSQQQQQYCWPSGSNNNNNNNNNIINAWSTNSGAADVLPGFTSSSSTSHLL